MRQVLKTGQPVGGSQMLETVAVVVGEIISVTVAVTLKRLVWGGTAGPCVSDDHRTCGGDVFITPHPHP